LARWLQYFFLEASKKISLVALLFFPREVTRLGPSASLFLFLFFFRVFAVPLDFLSFPIPLKDEFHLMNGIAFSPPLLPLLLAVVAAVVDDDVEDDDGGGGGGGGDDDDDSLVRQQNLPRPTKAGISSSGAAKTSSEK